MNAFYSNCPKQQNLSYRTANLKYWKEYFGKYKFQERGDLSNFREEEFSKIKERNQSLLNELRKNYIEMINRPVVEGEEAIYQ